MKLCSDEVYWIYFNVLNLILLWCKNYSVVVGFFHNKYDTEILSSPSLPLATAATVVAEEEEEAEGAFMVDCCLLFSFLLV